MESVVDVTIAIEGMTCGHCVQSVQSALAGIPELEGAQVAVSSARLRVPSESATATTDAAIRAIQGAGYEARVAQ